MISVFERTLPFSEPCGSYTFPEGKAAKVFDLWSHATAPVLPTFDLGVFKPFTAYGFLTNRPYKQALYPASKGCCSYLQIHTFHNRFTIQGPILYTLNTHSYTYTTGHGNAYPFIHTLSHWRHHFILSLVNLLLLHLVKVRKTTSTQHVWGFL